ncbi:MAG: chorismate mutase [Woeseiaceae bacterium]|nr:chorismate mutase [Woeseiaceae bacterium]
MDLDNLREELTGVDRQLVELIARRQEIVARIGRDKQVTGRATRDFEREKEVLNLAREHALSLSVDPKLAESVLRHLIQSSLASQERDRVAAEGKGDGRSVLVIGGAGKMGGWFADFFRSQGFATSIADAAVEDGDATWHNWKDAGVDFDIIVVATPLAISGVVLAELSALRPRGLVFDIGSPNTAEKRTPRIARYRLQGGVIASDVRPGHRAFVRPSPYLCRRRLRRGDGNGEGVVCGHYGRAARHEPG